MTNKNWQENYNFSLRATAGIYLKPIELQEELLPEITPLEPMEQAAVDYIVEGPKEHVKARFGEMIIEKERNEH